jgi:cytochrome o ubiquinol oxidase operon protein cyoD
MSVPGAEERRELRSYVIGYGLALAATAAAFAAVRWRTLLAGDTLAAVLGLGLAQMIVHFRFFLHVGLGRSSRDKLWLVAFAAVVIALMVSGTLVVIFNLRQRMM